MKLSKKIWDWIRSEPDSDDPLRFAKQIQKNLNEPFSWEKFAKYNEQFFHDINNKVINIGDYVKVVFETGNIRPEFIGNYGQVHEFQISGYSVLLGVQFSDKKTGYFHISHRDLEIVTFEEFAAWEVLDS